ETRRISLSLRRTQNDPWQVAVGQFSEGQIVEGTVTRLAAFGAFARLEGNVEGLIHISELTDHHIRHPKEVVTEGESYQLKILRIEPERRRLGLSLRQAEG
ncbi:MAG: S1 RNA-binding domain-containing protein, partial [Dehalococcoidia bacterium]|nr:S1 RNA-binding domain-containing protein [Dehalococcoidia bacterium]